MEEIRKYFERMVTLTESDWKIFSSKLIRRELPKKTVIVKVGQRENYLSFIEKGIIRFCVPTEFDDLTFGFAFSNNFVSAYEYFLTQKPAAYQVETIADTVLWS